MLVCGVAVRPGLIAVTPAMHGSLVSAAAVHVNGTGENLLTRSRRHSVIDGARDLVWLGSVVVRALDWPSKGHEFDSRPLRRRVTILGKLFTHMCLCHQAV